MIEAVLMGGLLPGPWSPWEFVGSTTHLANGIASVEAKFPSGVQADDLVVTLMSPRREEISVTMVATGWLRLAQGGQDYVCAARYVAGLPPPTYALSGSNSVFVAVLVFRAKGWSSVKLEAHVSPAAPVSLTTKMQNELLLAVGVTPQTTRSWDLSILNAEASARVERVNAPAMQVYSANIDFPHQVAGISVDASSGAERNLILIAS